MKLESLKFSQSLNHFALKAKIYLAANKAAWRELDNMKNYKTASHELINSNCAFLSG
ncbi:hypothetical protein EZS27_027034 [termite gut metagenome]|uniref:Uncharacterized protein n=1 Tax=termite gut metagenome TaxID=433724 RepID=A0A5J4QR76_9ZZZZ